jgi:hypothetical protein
VAGYIVGEFGLTHGSLVGQEPSRFGLVETWELEGDHLGLGIFSLPERAWKTDAERADIDERLLALSAGWALRSYPWAGAVSTAHSILYYDRFGPDVFKELARRRLRETVPGARRFEADLGFDPTQCERAGERERDIWGTLVMNERRIGRAAYEAHAARMPRLRARPSRVVFAVGASPSRVPGRRPSHAANAARR